MPDGFSPANLVVAALVGLAVGIEREWSGHASGPAARFAGARTFLMLGLLGGLAGELAGSGLVWPAGALLLVGGALAVAAYVTVASRGGEDPVDGTTEVAALVVLGLGAVAGLGDTRLAAAAGAVVVLALREKSTIHGFVRRLDETELRGALQFAVLALVFLPILPAGPIGPLGGIRPRGLWAIVLIVSGISFAGYIARRAVGPRRGPALSGLLGGLASSTAVALHAARESRRGAASHEALAVGVVGASAILLPRIVAVTLLVRPALAVPVMGYLLPAFVASGFLLWVRWRRGDDSAEPDAEAPRSNPLRLGSALLLALGFQAILTVLYLVRQLFGDTGLLPTAAFLGLTDMDGVTYSMARLVEQGTPAALAASAIAVAALANTAFKLGAVLALGVGRFRRLAADGLLLQAVLILGALVLGWMR